ncbi:MAG: NUDIX hydrolase [Bacteroidetes bacterium]|nr:NUDIX hydrolase [Bacteroidota bacterium]
MEDTKMWTWDDDRRDHELEEKVLRQEEIYKGKLLHVVKETAHMPNGTESTREWIVHPGACAIIAVHPDGLIEMVRQYRIPLRQTFLEVPAGKIDAGEDPQVTAKRELKEETGYTAASWGYCGSFHPGIGYSDEVIHVYCAWELTRHQQSLDGDEFLLHAKAPFHEAVQAVREGHLTDAKTMSTLTLAWQWWQKNEPFTLPHIDP